MVQKKSKNKTRNYTLNFELWPKQLKAFNSFAQERLYGGGAGSGKSYLEKIEAIALCLEISGLQFFLFRRDFQDLLKSYVEGPHGFNSLLGELIHDGAIDSVLKEIRFPNGSKLYLCHCQYPKDVFGFNSYEFHVLNIAEAGEFTPFMIRYLRSRVRMDIGFQSKLPKRFILAQEYWRDPLKQEYSLPRATYSCNPMGPAKSFLEYQFVIPSKGDPDYIWRAEEDEGGMLRQFIPALLADNPSLDPVSYASSLKGIGSKGYVEALLQGSWKAVVGAYFPEIDLKQHIIKPFGIPEWWTRTFAMDWGACGDGDPFSCVWAAVSDGSISLYPSGSLIIYRNYYGHGLPKVTVGEVAKGILKRETKDPHIISRVAGGDIKEQRGTGPSIYELFGNEGIHFLKADQRRVSGWQQIRERLVGKNGIPAIFWFEECLDELETMMNLQHDLNDPNDCTQADDHYAESIRYLCMSRPYVVTKPLKALTLEEQFKPPNIDQLWELKELEKGLRR